MVAGHDPWVLLTRGGKARGLNDDQFLSCCLSLCAFPGQQQQVLRSEMLELEGMEATKKQDASSSVDGHIRQQILAIMRHQSGEEALAETLDKLKATQMFSVVRSFLYLHARSAFLMHICSECRFWLMGFFEFGYQYAKKDLIKN